MVLLAALVLALLPLVFWLMPTGAMEWVSDMSSLSRDALRPTALSPWLGSLITLVPVAISLTLLWQLWQLFGSFAAGRALTHGAQQHLRRFALAMLAMAVCDPIHRAAMSVVFSLGNPPGQRQLIIKLSSNDDVQLLLALVLLAIATVMGEAVRASDENRTFV